MCACIAFTRGSRAFCCRVRCAKSHVCVCHMGWLRLSVSFIGLFCKRGLCIYTWQPLILLSRPVCEITCMRMSYGVATIISLFCRALLQKRPIIWRSLLIGIKSACVCHMKWLRWVCSLKSCLFCKRALEKRQYSAKETNNFKEPTNRSQPIHVNVCT